MLAVEFTETINLGAILVVLLGLALATFFTVRSNVAKYWREVAEAEQRRVTQLNEKLGAMVPKDQFERALAEKEEERRLKHDAINEVAALRLTRDLTPLIKSQQELMGRVVAIEEQGDERYANAMKYMADQFAKHEQRAQDRHEALLEATLKIVERLNR